MKRAIQTITRYIKTVWAGARPFLVMNGSWRSIITWSGIALLSVVIGFQIYQVMLNRRYSLDSVPTKLLVNSPAQFSKLKETKTAFTYNQSDETRNNLKRSLTISTDTNDTGSPLYQAEISKKAADGITFGDFDNQLDFKMVPRHALSAGRLDDGRVVYPQGLGSQHVYTYMRNGLKEDILLDKSPGDSAEYSWDLQLGNKLEARLMPDGSVGIYSADPSLYNNIQISDDKSQKLIDKARTSSVRNNLAFVIPKPYIKDVNGTKNYDDVSYKLDGGKTLTLEARNLDKQQYPLSIDPSVVVTTSADFHTGFDDGMIDYNTANQIGRDDISLGTLGTFSATTAMGTARDDSSTVAYNGYLYMMGGRTGAGFSADTSVEMAPIDPSTGAIGTWAPTTSLSSATYSHESVAYNGYMYVIGGVANGITTAVMKSTISSVNGTLGSWTATTSLPTALTGITAESYNGYMYVLGGTDGTSIYNTVEKAPINADGTLGSWTSTTSFTTAREEHQSVVYNGYIYVLGGMDGATTNVFNTVEKAAINPDGTLGSWSATASFTTARRAFGAEVSDGHIYVMGGYNSGSSPIATVFYAPINADGTLDPFASTNSFSTARAYITSAAYNGYIYVAGGNNNTAVSANVQKAQITTGASTTLGTVGNFGPGTVSTNATTTLTGVGTTFTTTFAVGDSISVTGKNIKTITAIGSNTSLTVNSAYSGTTSGLTYQHFTYTTAFTNARSRHGSVAYNGYIYVVGGANATTHYNDVQKAPINSDGTVGTWTTTTSFTTGRNGLSVLAYNGYMYVLGGFDGTNYLNDVQVAAINPSDGTVGTWTTTSSFTTGREYFGAAAYNGYMYITGGTDNVTADGDVQMAAIDPSDGTVGTWTTTTAFTTARGFHNTVAYNGFLYIVGGGNYCGCTPMSDVQVAPIDPANGTIGTWTTTTVLPSARRGGATFAYNGYMYWGGGTDNNDMNDVIMAPINSDGTIGSWTETTFFNTPHRFLSAVAYNGNMYVLGGDDGALVNFFNDVQYAQIRSPDLKGSYERTINLGSVVTSVTSISFGGTSVCGAKLSYKLAGSNGVFGSVTDQTWAFAGTTYTISVASKQYVWVKVVLDDSQCGTNSKVTDITVNYTLNPPAAPTLSTPSNVATNQSLTPQFQMRTTDADNDYLRYKIEVCSTSNCSSVVRTIDQTASQTGWSGQNQQTGTAYTGNSVITSSTMAVHTYQSPPLTAATQYWWRAYAIDPAGSNTFSTASSIFSFTTSATPAAPTLTAPSNAATGQSLTPLFQFRTTDADNDYLRYKIEVCSTSNCSSVVRTIDQTASQTGWSGQNQQVSTAYTGNSVIGSSTMANHTYQSPPLTAGTQYWWRAYGIDPGGSNTFSSASGINTFTTNATPAAPTLTAPANSATNVSATPLFQFRSTDANNDYLRYKIEVCSTSNCSSVVRTIDQTASQTGWTGQDTQVATAYIGNSTITSSTMANHTYQAAALSSSTQYWWRAYAIDPGGINVFSSASGINSFTTAATPTPPAAPTLASPANNATGVATLPQFRLSTTDAQSDYVKYKIEVCSTSNCSSVVRTIDQTASQTGWVSQDASSGTAYDAGTTLSASTLAAHNYQAGALAANTQYWWRAYAIDPGDSNTFSSASAISTFTTSNATHETSIRGGTTITGGSRINQ